MPSSNVCRCCFVFYAMNLVLLSLTLTCSTVLQSKVSADYDYTPQQDTELELRYGDVITVVDKSDNSWWDGRIERDGVVHAGFFPSNYVHAI